MIACLDKKKPYPGLRPFRADEADLFFGREEQVDNLLEKLQSSRFVAVIGPSGCGKSSLVRAGLIPALRTGFLTEAGARWRIVQMRPGHQPYHNLAKALLYTFKDDTPLELVKAELKRGQRGLVEVIRSENLRSKENVLLIVDQFEELFRFRQNKNIDEVTAFINLLINCAHQQDVAIYIVITMRSDYLGECSLFHGLPEILNDNQFLTPRLTRDQSRKAIVGPALVMEGEIEPMLVNTLLNDLWVDHDQLPLLQHALMRMWTLVNADRKEEESREPELNDDTSQRVPECNILNTGHYITVGKLSNALSLHANHVYGKLDGEQQRIASIMFKRLTDRTAEQKDVRRPTTIKEIAAVAGTSVEQVVDVSKKFRAPDNNFLMPEEDVEVLEGSYLDLSHESIMRQWDTLKTWMDEEQESSKKFRWLADTVKFNSEYLRGSELKTAVSWEAQQQPNKAWAERYAGNFDEVIAFIRQSKVKSRNNRLKGYGIIVLFVVSMSGLAFMQVKNSRMQVQNSRMQVKNLMITEDLLRKEKEKLIQGDSLYKFRSRAENWERENRIRDSGEAEMRVVNQQLNEKVRELNVERKKLTIEKNRSNALVDYINSPFAKSINIDSSTKRQGEEMLLSYAENNLTIYRSKLESLNELATAIDLVRTSPNKALNTIKKIWKFNREPIFRLLSLQALNGNLFYVQKFSPRYAHLHTTSFSINKINREFIYNIESEVVQGTITNRDSLIVKIPKSLNINSHITSLAITNNKEIIARIKSRLLSWRNGVKSNISFPVDTGSYVKISPDGRLLFTVSNKLQLWKIDDLKKNKNHPIELKAPAGIRIAAFSPDSKLIALGYENRVVLWSTDGHFVDSVSEIDLNKRDSSKNQTDEKKELYNDNITGVNISEDGKTIVIGTYEGKLKIWRRHNTSQLIEMIDLKYPLSDITRISISPDAKKLLLGSPIHPYTLYVNLNSSQIKKIADPETLFVHCDFINDTTIISADYLGRLHLWKAYPYFSDVDKAFSVIKTLALSGDQDSPGNNILKSHDADSIAAAVDHLYLKGKETRDKNSLAAAGQLCLELIKMVGENLSAQYKEYLLKINDELNKLDPLDYPGTIDRLKQNIQLREELLKVKRRDSLTLKYKLSNDYGSLSWYLLLQKDFKDAIRCAQKGLDIYRENDWIYTKLALGYLLTRQFGKSDVIYIDFKYRIYSNGSKAFKRAFLEDFENLEKAGIISPRDQTVYLKVKEMKIFLR